MASWTMVLAVEREVGRSGHFQDIFSKAESTDCEDRDSSLLFGVLS